MKTKLACLSAAVMLAGAAVFSVQPVNAAPKAKTYANCTELQKDYKGGVAKSANIVNKGGKTKYKPYVSADLYALNTKSDRDKDGIACEK